MALPACFWPLFGKWVLITHHLSFSKLFFPRYRWLCSDSRYLYLWTMPKYRRKLQVHLSWRLPALFLWEEVCGWVFSATHTLFWWNRCIHFLSKTKQIFTKRAEILVIQKDECQMITCLHLAPFYFSPYQLLLHSYILLHPTSSDWEIRIYTQLPNY